MKFKRGPEIDYTKVVEMLRNDLLPPLKQYADTMVAQRLEDMKRERQSRLESIELYLARLYEAQKNGVEVFDEISTTLALYRLEALGIDTTESAQAKPEAEGGSS